MDETNDNRESKDERFTPWEDYMKESYTKQEVIDIVNDIVKYIGEPNPSRFEGGMRFRYLQNLMKKTN